jgi:hypothetical protein
MNNNVIYEEILLSDVVNNPNNYNSNNHWNNGVKPNDYFKTITQFDLKHWIHNLGRPFTKIVITDKSDLLLLTHINMLFEKTGKFRASLFEDELNTLVNKYNFKYPSIFNGEKYFVRCENVSLKYGADGLIPFVDFYTIIKSIVTSPYGHTPLYSDSEYITLYLFPWLELDISNEFRVFVKNRQITCISQQHWYKCLHIHSNELTPKIQIIIDYFNAVVLNLIEYEDFSYDFTFHNNQPYFIEFNSFGKEYASGSALFHWLIDYDKLYGNSKNSIYMRYVIEG